MIGQCFGGGSAAGLHFRITVTARGTNLHRRFAWAHGLGQQPWGLWIRVDRAARSTAGYEKTGIDRPATGRKAALESFDTGDVIGVSVVAGVMSVTKNGGTPVVVFNNVPSQGMSVSVWSAPRPPNSFAHRRGWRDSGVRDRGPVATHAAPFIAATRYPSHAVSVASLGRTAPRPSATARLWST